jgi:very-short-patch-repair endonuclease/endogenous inhibitor of DNA gyrase (YacG/DUF329 family)
MSRPLGSKNGVLNNIIKICQICGKEYIIEKHRQGVSKYCSKQCLSKHNSIRLQKERGFRTCSECGKQFKLILKNRNNKFCCRKCSDNHHKGMMVGEKSKKWINRITRYCKICGKEFETTKRINKMFCSKKCVDISFIKKITKKCEICGKEYKCKPCLAKIRHTCSRQCRTSLTKKSDTSIEIKMEENLNKNNIKHSKQFGFLRYTFDFAIPELKIAIECDGDYWHSLKSVIIRDETRDATTLNHGWITLRFKETDIKNNMINCIKTIKEEIWRRQNQ